jgi:Cu+-exporting ATPase
MTCVNCAAAIQKDISKLVGVQSTNVNYANEKAVIEYDPSVTGLEKFVSSIHESGYQAVTETVTIPVIDLDVSRSSELERIAGAIDGVLRATVNPAAGTADVEYVPGQSVCVTSAARSNVKDSGCPNRSRAAQPWT